MKLELVQEEPMVEGRRRRARRGSRETSVLIRLTKEEHEAAQDAARRAGIADAEWWRRCAREAIAAELNVWTNGLDIVLARDATHAESIARKEHRGRRRKPGGKPFTAWPSDETLTTVDDEGRELELLPSELVKREGRACYFGAMEDAEAAA